MDLFAVINRFYYDMTLHELSAMNANTLYPNITYNSLLYLDLISYKKNCTASYLADALHISRSAVTLKLNELIRQGFVQKVQSKDDRRVFYLQISPPIQKEYKEIQQKSKTAVLAIEKKYSKQDINLLCDMLETFSTSYQIDKENHDDTKTI